MLGGKITAVIGVKRLWNTRDLPLRQGLTPHSLAQDERRVDGGWRLYTEPKAGNGPAVIIHNDGQPGPHQLSVVMAHPQIQQGMIGLPDIVGSFSFAPVEQIV